MTVGHLGRLVPTDWDHVEKYPLRALSVVTPVAVEGVLRLPDLRPFYDQGSEGACVGFGWSWAMTILNRHPRAVPRYNAQWLYDAAQRVDEYSDTPPAEGTSVRAGGDVLRDVGHVRTGRGFDGKPSLDEGIATNRWAATVDEMRAGLALRVPIVIGVNWYENFDAPVKRNAKTGGSSGGGFRESWIGTDGTKATDKLGAIRGGHCVCIYGASDRRQAFKIVNNWGMAYPLVWMPYEVMARLLAEEGEAALITDR